MQVRKTSKWKQKVKSYKNKRIHLDMSKRMKLNAEAKKT